MTNAKDACEKLKIDRGSLLAMRDKILEKGKDWKGADHLPWFTDEAMALLESALELKEVIEPKLIQIKVLQQASNPRFVWAYDDSRQQRVACLIPAMYTNRLVGKVIDAERIEDESGVTYRHSFFTRTL